MKPVERTILLSGALVVAGLLLAPLLTPEFILPVSAVWWLALLLLARAAWLVLAYLLGRWAAALPVAIGLMLPVALTTLPAGPALATHLPCPRNWMWMPTWFLRSSPMGSTSATIGGARVKLCYGRPAARGRRMLGGRYVPFGQLWRTGANEPTMIITTTPLEVAGVPVPAGRTALYSVPGPESWEIILNRSTSQWGIESEYSEAVRAQEIGRGIVASRPAGGQHVERLEISFDPATADSATLVLHWESTVVRVPVRSIPR